MAVVKAADVVIKDSVIDGNLIVAEGVSDGSFVLDNATVTGELIFRGECLRPSTLLGPVEGNMMNLVEVSPNAQIYSVSGADKNTYTTGKAWQLAVL